MSNRGWLVSSPHSSRSKVISETAHSIPLFWLSFLSMDDVKRAAQPGQFELDRKRAVERGTTRLPFFASLFPKIRSFGTVANSLIQKIETQKSRVIGIEVTELLDDGTDPARPDLGTAVDVIEHEDAHYSFTVPERTVMNPFTRTEVKLGERLLRTTQDLLLQVCMIEPDFLTSKSRDYIRETIIGTVWSEDS